MQSTVPYEIERKYLLSALPPHAAEAKSVHIEQGWIPGTQIHERLRKVSDSKGSTYFRTIKVGKGVRRIELEDTLDADLFARMWPLTKDKRISKTRHKVKEDKHTWEIDVFDHRPLVLAEIELDDADAKIEFPEWLKPYVLREVTDDPAYVNLNLATAQAP